MSNNLIESTINFVNNTSKINGNLRSGVIKEESDFSKGFSKEHIESGLTVLAHHQKNGHPYPDDAVFAHGVAKGMSPEEAGNFTKTVRDHEIGLRYAKGPKSSGDPGVHDAVKGYLQSNGFT